MGSFNIKINISVSTRLILGFLLVLIQISTSTSFPFRVEDDAEIKMNNQMTLSDIRDMINPGGDIFAKRSTKPRDADVTIHDRKLLAHLEHCSVVCRFCRLGLPRSVSARCNLDCLDNGHLYQACFVFWNSSSGVIKDR